MEDKGFQHEDTNGGIGNNIKDFFKCPICLCLVNIPVLPNCDCENQMGIRNSNFLKNACLGCVRSYLNLNDHPNNRGGFKRSFQPCCDKQMNPRCGAKCYKINHSVFHIRDIIGKTTCYHPKCGKKFDTTLKCLSHLRKECDYSQIKCQFCHIYGQRSYIKGEHYRNNHYFICCYVCNDKVQISFMEEHLKKHQDDMLRTLEKMNMKT